MNENEFKNYYQILGIDKSLIDYVIYDKKKDGKYENKLRNEASKDKKIKEAYEICKNKLCKKYEDRIFKLEKESKLKIGMIERGIENNTDLLKKSKLIGEKESFEESVKYEVKEIKEQFNKRLAEIKEAYEALKTDGARKLYDDQLKEKELEKKNVTVETMATTSNKAFLRTDLTNGSKNKISSDKDAKNAVVAAMLTKAIDENTKSKAIIFSNTMFATNMQISYNMKYPIEFYNNEDVLLNTVSYLTDREDNITIRKTTESIDTYDVTARQLNIVLLIIFIIPTVIIVAGIVVWQVRRRKK